MEVRYTLITDLRTESGEVRDLLYRTVTESEANSRRKGKTTSEIVAFAPRIRTGDLVAEQCGCYFGNYLTVLPALFDAHMHCYEPGAAWLETVESAVTASLAGGFGGCALMPNTRPCVDDPRIVQLILEKNRLQGDGYALFLCGSLTRRETQNAETRRDFLPAGRADGRTLTDFAALRQAGVAAFSDHGAPIGNDAVLMDAMQRLAALDALLVIDPHAPDFPCAMATPGKTARMLGLTTVPPAAETLAVARALALARETGCRIHIQHISTAQSVAMVRHAKQAQGVRVTCETSPPYFILNDTDLFYHGAKALFEPPLRSDADVAAVRQGIADGTIDCIASDHTPCEEREKQELTRAIPGATMAETAFALSYSHLVRSGVLTLSELIDRMRTAPQALFGCALPTLEVGQRATFHLMTREELILQPAHFHGKTRCSPFLGLPLSGMTCATVCNGQYTPWLATAAPQPRPIKKAKKKSEEKNGESV